MRSSSLGKCRSNQMAGPHLEFLDLVTLTPFNDLHDYENYISRLHQIPKALDQTMANMRQGIQDRLMPPRFLLEKVAVQAQEIAEQDWRRQALSHSRWQIPQQVFLPTIKSGCGRRFRQKSILIYCRRTDFCDICSR